MPALRVPTGRGPRFGARRPCAGLRGGVWRPCVPPCRATRHWRSPVRWSPACRNRHAGRSLGRHGSQRGHRVGQGRRPSRRGRGAQACRAPRAGTRGPAGSRPQIPALARAHCRAGRTPIQGARWHTCAPPLRCPIGQPPRCWRRRPRTPAWPQLLRVSTRATPWIPTPWQPASHGSPLGGRTRQP